VPPENQKPTKKRGNERREEGGKQNHALGGSDVKKLQKGSRNLKGGKERSLGKKGTPGKKRTQGGRVWAQMGVTVLWEQQSKGLGKTYGKKAC